MEGLGTDGRIFALMVFVAVVLLATSVIVPTVGSQAQASKRMKRRIGRVLDSIDPGTANLLRDRYLGALSPTERAFETIPGMRTLRERVMQAGITRPAYVFLLLAIAIGGLAAAAVQLTVGVWWIALAVGLVAATLPFTYVSFMRARRLARFEEQLPEALDMMARALQAGHPFNETLRMVGDEMADPIATEFTTAFTDINFGLPPKTAFVGMLARVPSISLNTLITAVLIQQETGGKLAEILMKIADVIRGRFRLNRKIRTLSAEGRLSAWILTLLPFVLALVIAMTTPSYLPMMTKDPLGTTIAGTAFVFVVIGNFWIRKIIRFEY